ncbi:MAG: precorrin-6A synthase (deacetylating) [Deltaproteobacteria bacterium]|nr:MAG: precorrin-6A synthase (deacetylating) [Deltaproteobacteria bacterium]
MRKIYLIGIGPGNSDYLTLQAIDTMKKVDVFFILEKEKGFKEFLKIRKEILEKYLDRETYRVVNAKIPKRKKNRKSYKEEVKTWREQKAEVITELIENKMKDGEIGAFLIWGDPSLYDGHLEILQHILKEGAVNFEYKVIPGITSIQILAARHKIPLNRIGESIVITTGRKLKEYTPDRITNTVVLLDNYSTFKDFKDSDIDIYWGGYLGSKDEILLSGRLKDIIEDLKKIRREAKREKSWLMDTYILRRPEGPESNE